MTFALPSIHLQWHKPLFTKRCKAVCEPRSNRPYSGRCDLAVHELGDHMLERGMDVVSWSTDWTG